MECHSRIIRQLRLETELSEQLGMLPSGAEGTEECLTTKAESISSPAAAGKTLRHTKTVFINSV